MTINLPKLLVLGSSLPGGKDGGGVVRDEVLKRFPRDKYVCFSTNASDVNIMNQELPGSLEKVAYRVAPLVPHLELRGERFYRPILRAIGFHLIALQRVRQAVKFGRMHSVELVWAELYGDCVVIAQKVSEKLKIPFVATVWDDPEGWLQDGGYDRFSRRLLWERFRQALQNAQHLSTAGEAMQRVYRQKYGVNSVILRHGLETLTRPSDNYGKSQNEVIIGFVGSLYGKESWMAFFSAVASLNKSGTLPRIKLRTFGGAKFPYSYNGVEIEDRGWQPQEVMMREIANTDFCYLPYWFDPAKRRHVELSFPNKFETYIAAGRPVFFHGPEYAGIAKTIEQYQVGICVYSLDQNEIIAKLKKLITKKTLRDQFSREAISAFHSEFNLNVMIKNFTQLIGIDHSILLGNWNSFKYNQNNS